jgi:hypothetical protein
MSTPMLCDRTLQLEAAAHLPAALLHPFSMHAVCQHACMHHTTVQPVTHKLLSVVRHRMYRTVFMQLCLPGKAAGLLPMHGSVATVAW